MLWQVIVERDHIINSNILVIFANQCLLHFQIQIQELVQKRSIYCVPINYLYINYNEKLVSHLLCNFWKKGKFHWMSNKQYSSTVSKLVLHRASLSWRNSAETPSHFSNTHKLPFHYLYIVPIILKDIISYRNRVGYSMMTNELCILSKVKAFTAANWVAKYFWYNKIWTFIRVPNTTLNYN